MNLELVLVVLYLSGHICPVSMLRVNVSYVTTYIIRSDYYSVIDKFKFKNTTVRTGN